MANIWTLLLGIAGFAVSFYIWHKKRNETPMLCVISKGKDCMKVVTSKYNNTFGIPNEILGFLYYGSVIIASILGIAGISTILGISLSLLVIIAAIIAVAMSAYFVTIMGFVIKKWCDYCIASSVISTLILIVELI